MLATSVKRCTLSTLLILFVAWGGIGCGQAPEKTGTESGTESGTETMTKSTPHDLTEASIAQLQQRLAQGELSSVELVDYYLARIEKYDVNGPKLNAIQHLNSQARTQAAALDQERQDQGPRSQLHGIPVLVKDNYETKEMPTTAGSLVFAGFHPDRDATLVHRLKAAGAIMLAKTTMHEFAYGITTVGSAFGATKNPYNLARNPGGSSGGTGAGVAANFAAVGMGSDTCGSIRIPAAQNNLVGLRATQGRLSRTGIVPLSSTQDIGGPIARSVQDLATVLDAITGLDPTDEQTEGDRTNWLAGLTAKRDARVGLLTDWLRRDAADDDVAMVMERALDKLKQGSGWQTSTLHSPAVNASVDRPWNGYAVLIYDFKADIEKYLAGNPSLGLTSLGDLIAQGKHHADIQDSLMASESTANEQTLHQQGTLYQQEMSQRAVVRQALTNLIEQNELDALVYPTIRQVAAPHGEPQLGTNCRLSANSGLPAISVPIGFTDAGMPVGIELLGVAHSEQQLLNLALEVEQALQARRLPDTTP